MPILTLSQALEMSHYYLEDIFGLWDNTIIQAFSIH